MAAGRDVDLLLWAVAEARRLRTEELVHPDFGTDRLNGENVRPETQFANEWEQAAPAYS